MPWEKRNDEQRVWLVKQTQPSADYIARTIYICSTQERAMEYARRLNKRWGANCHFDENWDFVDVDNTYYFDDVHFYNVESMPIDEDLVILDEKEDIDD